MSSRTETKVLVVEDELVTRVDLAEAIELEGRCVIHVPSAEDALHVLEKDHGIGLVLTDIKMTGGLDGIELARHIRSRWPDIRLVISSGNIKADHRCGSIDAALLHKPYKLHDLRRVLGRPSA